MTAQSSAQSSPNVAQSSAHTMCVPYRGTHCVHGGQALCADGQESPARSAVIETVVSSRASLTSSIAPDPEVTAWVVAVRARFPGARPLWGTSSVGTVGREP
jgi:hypothetical protein